MGQIFHIGPTPCINQPLQCCVVDRGEEEHKLKHTSPGKSSASLSSLVLLHSWGVIVLITLYIERLDVRIHDPRVCAENEDLSLFINKPAFLSCLPGRVSTGFEAASCLRFETVCLMSERIFCVLLFNYSPCF